MRRALDEVMPVFDRQEYHELEVAGTPEAAVAAFLATPVASGRIVGALLRVRGVGTGGTISDLFTRLRFAELHRSEAELVVGASGMPWRPGGGIGPFADQRPATVKLAIDVRAEALADNRALLSTETRILAADADARRKFVRYWRVVGPFSALIRRRWLLAARAALARPDTGS